MKAPTRRTLPLKHGSPYRQLWRLVDGAVADAFKAHPDYLSPKGKFLDTARRSIVKRVVGAVLGYAGEASKPTAQSRSRASSNVRAADTVHEGVSVPRAHGGSSPPA